MYSHSAIGKNQCKARCHYHPTALFKRNHSDSENSYLGLFRKPIANLVRVTPSSCSALKCLHAKQGATIRRRNPIYRDRNCRTSKCGKPCCRTDKMSTISVAETTFCRTYHLLKRHFVELISIRSGKLSNFKMSNFHWAVIF
jgi:hypothetical protein